MDKKRNRNSKQLGTSLIVILAENLPYPKGNHPSKIQPSGVRRFGGVREQISTPTPLLTYKCYYRVINDNTYILFQIFEYRADRLISSIEYMYKKYIFVTLLELFE